LWFKIITPTVQSDVREQPNTGDREGASNLYHKARKTIPIHQPTKQTSSLQDTVNTGLWNGRELGAVHVPLYTKQQD